MPKLESFDGTRLAYEDEGDGPPVLLLHGFASDSFINWVRPGITDALKGAGFRVIALDQRGHGASDKPHSPEAYADGAMGRDAVALLDHLDIEKALLAGYSMGAINTLRLCSTTERVAAAVFGGIGETTMKARGGHEGLAEALLAEDKSTVTNPIAKSFRDFADLTGADRRALAAVSRHPREVMEDDLAAVDVPVLVITGDNDPLAGDPHPLAAVLSHARAVVVGGSHLNVINNPAFQRELVDFLTEHRDLTASSASQA